jgi:hypothetical protein
MEFEVAPKVLLETLKRLMPRRVKLIQKWSTVTLRTNGKSLDVIGEFENSWSVSAHVIAEGECAVDLVALTRSLQLYPPNTQLRFTLGIETLKFGTTKMKLYPVCN